MGGIIQRKPRAISGAWDFAKKAGKSTGETMEGFAAAPPNDGPATARQVAELREMVATLLEKLANGATPDRPRTSYSVEEVAALIDRRPFTVREWCRAGRIEATKRQEKRGGVELWAISAGEVERYRNEGLRKAGGG